MGLSLAVVALLTQLVMLPGMNGLIRAREEQKAGRNGPLNEWETLRKNERVNIGKSRIIKNLCIWIFSSNFFVFFFFFQVIFVFLDVGITVSPSFCGWRNPGWTTGPSPGPGRVGHRRRSWLDESYMKHVAFRISVDKKEEYRVIINIYKYLYIKCIRYIYIRNT